MTVINEFQQLNLFVFELLFYVIGDMSVKSIVKFVVFLASLLKRKYQLFKKVPITKGDGPFFSREIFYLLCGLRPRPKLPRP